MNARRAITAAASVTAAALAFTGVAATAASSPRSTPSDRVVDTLSAGAQTTGKHTTRPTDPKTGLKAPNPYVALVPDPSKVDWAYWRYAAERASAREAKAERRAGERAPVPFVHDEQEPAGTVGSNDTVATAEPVDGFGTGAGERRAVRILGDLFVPVVPTDELATTEDQGAIPIATETGIPADSEGVTVESVIGDGPHGSTGDDSGDFDFFELGAEAGQLIGVDTAGSELDTVVALYDADGNLVAFNDDVSFPDDLTSVVRYRVPADGDYYAMVGGFGFAPIPDDPFDSGSGGGSGDEGDYNARITVGVGDADYYAVHLRSGDTLGGVIQGGSPDITVTKPSGVQAVGSVQDASFIYPGSTRLPGGGNATFAYVAERTGWYAVSTLQGGGQYDVLLEVYRPRPETQPVGTRQTIFLDFDGERVNTAVWGGPGVRTLSPLTSFLGRWGLTNADRNALIDEIIRTVAENVRHDLKTQGLNPHAAVRILNSRDDPDPFGRANVSRVIVGGTIEQSGIGTIGIASSIDPGNFEGEDQALVLLDTLSGPDDDDASLNAYLDDSSDRVGFVGQAIGNVTAHEIGHYVGSFHVNQFNARLNLMDQGGNFPLLYGVGPDGIGGTADDPDVDFAEDIYNPGEGFTGIEDTLNISAWAISLGQGG